MMAVLVVYAGAALAQPSEKIFFGRWLYKDCPGLCTMNPNGSGSQPIKLHDSASDAAPSPDGSKIAYVADPDWETSGEPGSDSELWVMNADGSGVTAITATGDHKLFGWGLHDPPDTARPTVSGMRPKPGSATSDMTPTISATVKDDATELSGEDITLYVAGSQVTTFAYDGATDKLTYTPPRLAKGKKTVKIVATDAARNVGTKSWSFTVR